MAISAVVVQEKNGRQHLVYFVSHALHDVEVRYSPLEKAALGLVHAAWMLKSYFQSHIICILTNLPLRQVLHKPEASGRLMKWAIKLGEHGIHYLLRKAIKGQALADFLVKLGEEPKPARDPMVIP